MITYKYNTISVILTNGNHGHALKPNFSGIILGTAIYRVSKNKMSQHENREISQKCVNIFAPNVAHLFSIQLCTLYLLDPFQIDGDTTFKNEFRN